MAFQIQELCMSPKLADVRFRVGLESVPAHRVILAAASPIFRAMLFETKEDGSFGLKLQKVPVDVRLTCAKEVLVVLLTFLYKGQCTLSPDTVVQVHVLASRFQLSGLEAVCQKYFEDHPLYLEQAVKLKQFFEKRLGSAQGFKVPRIRDISRKFLFEEAFLKMSKSSLITLLQMDGLPIKEVDLWRAIERWGAKQADDDDVKEVLRHIRLPLLSAEELVLLVQSRKIVTPQVLQTALSFSAGSPEWRHILKQKGEMKGISCTPRLDPSTYVLFQIRGGQMFLEEYADFDDAKRRCDRIGETTKLLIHQGKILSSYCHASHTPYELRAFAGNLLPREKFLLCYFDAKEQKFKKESFSDKTQLLARHETLSMKKLWTAGLLVEDCKLIKVDAAEKEWEKILRREFSCCLAQ